MNEKHITPCGRFAHYGSVMLPQVVFILFPLMIDNCQKKLHAYFQKGRGKGGKGEGVAAPLYVGSGLGGKGVRTYIVKL